MSKLLIALYVIATSTALIAIKMGTKNGSPIGYINEKLTLNINIPLALGIIFYGFSFVLYIYLIAKYDLGYIIPLVTAFVYICIFFTSYFLFKEVFTIPKIIGISLIISGVMFMNLNK